MSSTQLLSEKRRPRRQRSPIERGIVWGAIFLLYLVLAFEWRSKRAYDRAAVELPAAITANEDSNAPPMTLEQVEKVMRRKPNSVVQDRYGITDSLVYTWRWRSLFKRYAIQVRFDPKDNTLINVL